MGEMRWGQGKSAGPQGLYSWPRNPEDFQFSQRLKEGNSNNNNDDDDDDNDGMLKILFSQNTFWAS